MLIQRQFHFAFAAISSAILTALGILVLMNARLQKIEDLRVWANDIVRYAIDCNILGSESILQDNARSREQYAQATASLQSLINHPPKEKIASQFLPEIAATKSRLDDLLRESSRPAANAPMERESFELQAMLASQWMLQSRGLLQLARDLRIQAARESDRVRRMSLWASSAAIVFVGLLTGVIFFETHKTLVIPLHDLSAGARRIGMGDLTGRLEVQRRNEIGMVAESFNAMTDQLAARQAEVEEKLRDLEAFSYSVAHDLKAPLRSIVGYGSFLEEEYADRLDAEGRNFLSRMRASALQMSSLVDDLLQFGQLTHKRIEIHPVSFQPLFQQLLAEMREEIAEQKATVDYHGDSPTVLANEVLLKQILRNLISNGMKFVPKGTSPLIQVSAKQNGTITKVEVRDNGIGIAPEHQRKIFGLFHRLHTQNEFSGTGIGLALVQKSIERLHGRVGVASMPGQGSTFWIELPQAEQNLAKTKEGPTQGKRGA